MKTLEELRRRIDNVEDMQSVVSTMKTLAAARIRQYESAADATRTYSQTIRLAFQVLMRDQPRSHLTDPGLILPQRRGLVLFGSDQGFCGSFNESISHSVTQFVNESDSQDQPTMLVIGTRLSQLMTSDGHEIDESLRLPNSVAKITELIQQVILKIDQWQNLHSIEHVELFYNRRRSASSYAARNIQLLPISADYLEQLGEQPWPARSRPVSSIAWETLFSKVVQQHLFLQLFRACSESLASENASRIAAMQKAESNIEQRLEQLNTEFNQSRQRAITEELLDIIAGFEAVSTSTGANRRP